MINKVDIILPICDRNPIKTLESILNQTYKNFRIVMCNDGEKRVYQEVKDFFDKNKFSNYLFIDPAEKYQGASATRNKCIRAGISEYIAYQDDTDIWYPDHLKTVITFLEQNKDKHFVFTKAWANKHPDCNEIRGEIWTEELNGWKKGFFVAPYNQPEMINYTNVVTTPLCVAHRRKCFDVGLFDEGIPCLVDWDLWQRMSLRYKIYHIDKFTGEYFVDGKGIITKYKQEAPKIAQIIKNRKDLTLVSELLEERIKF